MTVKRFVKMTSAAAISLGMVGTFALPAYATAPAAETLRYYAPVQQSLETASAVSVELPNVAPDGAVDSAVLEAERQQKEAEAQLKASKLAAAANVNKAGSTYSGKDLPAGVGAQGLVAAALAQLGDNQDCTAVLERALRAIGYNVGDLGTRTAEYTALGGVEVTGGDYAPGDVLLWPGQPHVAVYIGNGQAVHGGYNGTTVIDSYMSYGKIPDSVVRFG